MDGGAVKGKRNSGKKKKRDERANRRPADRPNQKWRRHSGQFSTRHYKDLTRLEWKRLNILLLLLVWRPQRSKKLIASQEVFPLAAAATT